MIQAVLDPNIIVAASLSPQGSPASVLSNWANGHYELVVSPQLLEELERVFSYPKIHSRVGEKFVTQLMSRLGEARLVEDPEDPPPVRCSDPEDDYLIALAAAAGAVLVTGDKKLLELAPQIPVFAAAEFLEQINL